MKLLSPLLISSLALSCEWGVLVRKGLTCRDKKEIDHFHNTWRSSLARGIYFGGPVQYMNMMVWNNTLAKKAQKETNSCYIKNSSIGANRFAEARDKYLVRESYSLPNFMSSFMEHWVEGYFVTYHPNHAKDILEFAQLSYTDSSQIGCGFSIFRLHAADPYWYHYLVCKYYPEIPEDTLPFETSPSNKPNTLCSSGLQMSQKYVSLCVVGAKSGTGYNPCTDGTNKLNTNPGLVLTFTLMILIKNRILCS